MIRLTHLYLTAAVLHNKNISYQSDTAATLFFPLNLQGGNQKKLSVKQGCSGREGNKAERKQRRKELNENINKQTKE